LGKISDHKQENNITQAIVDLHFSEGLSVTALARVLSQMKMPTKKEAKNGTTLKSQTF